MTENVDVNNSSDIDIYENEYGYKVFKSFSGRTPGRHLKRLLLKYVSSQLLFGVIFVIMSSKMNYNLSTSTYIHSTSYGSSIQTLMWLSSLLPILSILFSFSLFYNWTWLTNSKLLFGTYIRLYMIWSTIMYIILIWTIIVYFLTFKGIKKWHVSTELATIYPYYVSFMVFSIPYAIINLICLLEMKYHLEEVELLPPISEASPNSVTIDSNNVDTFDKSITYLIIKNSIAIPIIFVINLWKYLNNFARFIALYYQTNPISNNNISKLKRKDKPMSTSQYVYAYVCNCCLKFTGLVMNIIFVNCFYLLFIRSSNKYRMNKVHIVDDNNNTINENITDSHIVNIKDDDSISINSNKSSKLKPLIDEDNHPKGIHSKEKNKKPRRKSTKKSSHTESNDPMDIETNDNIDNNDIDEDGRDDHEKVNVYTKLSYNKYMTLFDKLPTVGSFDCKLIDLPDRHTLKKHLKKKGFEIVHISTDGSDDNLFCLYMYNANRSNDNEGDHLFLSRFSISQSLMLSVTIKCSSKSPGIIENHVKRFELAKILSLDDR